MTTSRGVARFNAAIMLVASITSWMYGDLSLALFLTFIGLANVVLAVSADRA